MPSGGCVRKRHIRRSGKSGAVSPRGEFRPRVLVVGIAPGVLCRGVDAAASQLLLAALNRESANESRFTARSARSLPLGISFATTQIEALGLSPGASDRVGEHFHRLCAGDAIPAAENKEGNAVRAESIGLLVLGDDGVFVLATFQQLFDTV